MNTEIQTYDSGDGRTILREGRQGALVRLSDYEALEQRLAELENTKPKIVTRQAGVTGSKDAGPGLD